MSNIHDNEIVSYEVDLKNHKIIIHSIQYPSAILTEIIFFEVLAHLFETQLEGSIIFDVNKYEVGNFFKDNSGLLEKQKSFCWPMQYDTIEELKEKLIEEQYAYYVISSSYGLNGWVLAKQYEIISGK